MTHQDASLTPAPPAPTPEVARRSFLTRTAAAVAGLALLARGQHAEAATEGTQPFLGEVMLFAGNFAPQGWALCNGQLLAISQNTALFSILGTQYGGNGVTTFALPNLQGRVALGAGSGPGLTPRVQGDTGGEENHTLIPAEMPAHTHTAFGDAANGTSESPAGLMPARDPAGVPQYGPGTTPAAMAANHLGAAGGSQPHNNMPPYLTLTYCIALQGVFPSRA